MSNIWTFSPTSENLLRRCIEAALLQETDNKWIQKFGCKTAPPLLKSNNIEENLAATVIEMTPSSEKTQETKVLVSYDDFFDTIESEINIDLIVKECSKNPDLLVKMAQRLPVNIVEKLFNIIFASEGKDHSIFIDFFHKFLPLYIKLQYSCICIDIMTKTNETYPEIFQKLLRILLEDTEIPNQVLNNYMSTLDGNKLTNFMENVTVLELSSESFVHNILTIYTAYKDCSKTANIQNWIHTNLLRHSKECVSENNYGRLFLAFLQVEKSLEHFISRQLAKCLEEHHSPFKKPCAMLVKELVHN